MSELTFVIACAPYHEAVVERAIESVRQQTISCEYRVVVDVNRKGPGWARNTGLASVNTPFVSFLDADDSIMPDFAAKTLAAWRKGKYVYTDWLTDFGTRQAAPVHTLWRGRNKANVHIVTTLLRTEDAKRIGWNESLPGAEDTDFYMRMMVSGVCGIHLQEPLFYYHDDGQRSKEFRGGPEYSDTMQAIMQPYSGVNLMACCNGRGPRDGMAAINEAKEGDVLVMAAWMGNRSEHGHVSGRRYPYTGNFARLYVDPRDAQARPDLWKRIEGPSALAQSPEQVGERIFGGGIKAEAAPTPLPVAQAAQPDFDKLFEVLDNES